MERDRKELGLVSVEAIFSKDDGGELNPLDTMMCIAGPETDQPDYRIRNAQNMRTKLACCSKNTKALIGMLLKMETDDNCVSPKLRELARILRIEGDELKRVKLEIIKTFGVQWQ